MVTNKEIVVSNEEVIAGIKKLFPDVKITILPALTDKGIGNPKKVADMKRILSKAKWSLPTQ